MADSAFWRKLAKKFRAFPREAAALIFAEKHWTSADKNDWTWRVGGDDTLRVHFEALARRAALALPELRHPDLLFSWLEALVRYGHARFDREILGTSVIGDVTVKSITGTMYKLPRHSADYCKILESEALQSVADSLTVPPKNMAPMVNGIPLEPNPRALYQSYVQKFPDERILIRDVCWAAGQHYREWKRWLAGQLKKGSTPDLAFRRFLNSGKRPSEFKSKPRPNGWE